MDGAAAAAWLAGWKRRYGLSDARAAEWLCISVRAFRRQRSGNIRVPRQTIRLAELYPIHKIEWVEVAEAAMKAARLARGPL